MATAPLSALIIDDEPLARQELVYLLEQAGGVSILAEGSNGIEAVELIRTHRPEVVFLDVRMPGLDGFAVLRKLLAAKPHTRLPEVVFATAFDQYAVKAFEVNAVDYLLKPFDHKRLQQTLQKLRARLRPGDEAEDMPVLAAASSTALQVAQPAAESRVPAFSVAEPATATSGTAAESPATRVRLWDVAQAKLDALLRLMEEQAAGSLPLVQTTPITAATPARTGRVVVRTGNRLLLVDQKDVCFAFIEEGRITVVTKTLEGDSNVRTLEELAEQLDGTQFWRAHRSFLVNLQHIREVVPWFKSSYQLRMDDRKGTEVPVSRSQTKRLRELFNL